MIHETFLSLTETATGSHPCLRSFSNLRSDPVFPTAQTRVQIPPGTSNQKLTRGMSILCLKEDRNSWILGPLSTCRAWPRMNTLICYNCIKWWYEHIRKAEIRLALACLHLTDGKGERACRRVEKASEIWCTRPSRFRVCASQ